MSAEPTPAYDADEITVLEGLEPVRVRPGMYIGSTTSRGLHHLIWEIVDNAVDEALAGHCTEITVTLRDDVMEVTDNGRGIPVATHSKSGESALDLVFTKLHAGGKFGGGGYKVSGGLHGVGASVTNALSEYLEAEVRRDGHAWSARYERGKSVRPVTKGRALKRGEKTGTTVTWRFDREIFDDDVRYSASTIEQRLREKSFLVRGLRFVLRLPGKDEQVFVSKNGIADLITEMNSERDPVHAGVISFSSEIQPIEREGLEGPAAEIPVEIALQWTKSADERLFSFANVVPTGDGGTHVSGLRRAVTRAMVAFAHSEGKLKKDKNETFEGRDIFEGLTAAVTVKLANPQFEGQTKGKLNNPEAQTAVTTYAYAAISGWLADKANAKQAKAILERCLLAREIRIAKGKISKKLRDNATSIFSDSNLPGKLADCLETRPVDERELFIVEGDSAMGCFVGDTKVALASGISLTLEELADDWKRGISHFGYASNAMGDVHIVPLESPRLTKRARVLVDVTLDNGEKLRCTPDHRFRLRDGSYRRADALVAGDSLMPLKRTLTEDTGRRGPGYESVNCKVVSVERIAETADVYDLTVERYNNFALEAGVFVHNSAKAARDANFQAIMPIRGKVLNVLGAGARNGRAFENAEIEGILTALGGRKDVIGRSVVATLEPQMRRYGKVVILADADVDGAHITNLLLTLFSELFPQMIAEGRVFIANPPLYRINLDARGERFVYALTDEERAELVRRHKRSGEDVSRFKGLGEMNAEDLARTTLDPETRSLLQVTVEDPTETTETLNLIMGSRPEPRRLWLEDIGLNDEVA